MTATAVKRTGWFRVTCWLALLCMVLQMFASFFFDDMFSSVSNMFEDSSLNALGWDSVGYGFYTGGYSVLCVFGGLVVCGLLLDRFGVRIVGSVFVTMMVAGAAIVYHALISGNSPSSSLMEAYVGCMLFGLGSEIAGTAVTRSIAKWFKDGPMALAMGLQLSISRLGTAFALVITPKLVGTKEFYDLSDTSRPALLGLGLMALGLIAWAVFVALDAGFDRRRGSLNANEEVKEEPFRLRDALEVVTNKNFLTLGALCVLFYSTVIAFKKFAGAILIPRFDIPAETAGWMVAMLPFATVIFAPLFGILVDKKGKATRWMLTGSVLSFAAHLLLGLAPQGVPFYGYLSMVFLGFGYSLVPAALWPSISRVVPEKALGTAYSLAYWIQNVGMLSFKLLAGFILGGAAAAESSANGPVRVEIMFIILAALAIAAAFILLRSSDRNPGLGLDK
ncbi:MAG: MFS transporter [Bacteroidales bacterium]|nr:MFS transporter [Bacteroidales bacterium]